MIYQQPYVSSFLYHLVLEGAFSQLIPNLKESCHMPERLIFFIILRCDEPQSLVCK
jgi:hypothetical protein